MTEGYFYFPCYNENKKTVSHVDIQEYLEMQDMMAPGFENPGLVKLTKKGCFPYFLKTSYKRGKTAGKILERSPHLQSNLNLCPKCKKFTLNFTEIGLFD